MIIKSLQTFGADYMSVVYSVIRHPTYAGYLLFGLGGVFFTFTLYFIIFYLIFLVGFYIHTRFVEEKELIERFGSSYKEYMKKVPAFFC